LKVKVVKIWAEAHLVLRWGELMAKIVVKESPSMIRGEPLYREATFCLLIPEIDEYLLQK
jgi:hypothetical protein